MKKSTIYSIIKIFAIILFCWLIIPAGSSLWYFIFVPIGLQTFGLLAILQYRAWKEENENI